MRGWVCVGAMAGFEVQVWWEGGHIQIHQYLYCCGAVGTAVLAHLWSFPVNISCLFANHILFPDTQHKWTRTCFFAFF